MGHNLNCLLPDLVALMDRVQRLIEESHAEALLPESRRIRERIEQPAFSVAVAGEFSRGKSTLINRLLGLDLLPVGDLPTTALLTAVQYGPEGALSRIHADGKREQLSLQADSWSSLVVQDDRTDPEGILQIEVPHPWLQQTGIQILDLPGAGDITGGRAAMALNAMASADATLVVVNATMALSLTERAFVEEQVLGRHVPRIAVVLTRLDQVSGPERVAVIDSIRVRLKEWAPQAILCSVHDAPVIPSNVEGILAGPESIRNLLNSWATDEGHQRLRTVQVMRQLAQLVTVLVNTLALKQAAMFVSEEERRRALGATETNLSTTRIGWEDLRLEMERREIQHGEWLEESLSLSRGLLLESLNHDLNRASVPDEWWERELPHRLRREFLVLGRSLSDALQSKLDEDAAWLNGEVQNQFSWESNLVSHRPSADIVPDNSRLLRAVKEPGQRSMADYTRLCSTVAEAIKHSPLVTKQRAAALLSSGLRFPPVRVLGFGMVLAGVVLSKLLELEPLDHRKKDLARMLEEVVDDAMRKGAGAIKVQLRACYRAMLEETHCQEEEWLAARRQAIQQGGQVATEHRAQVEQQLKQAAELLAAFHVPNTGAQR